MKAARGPARIELVEDYAAALADLRRVRDAVFVDEQRVPAEIERDDIDPQCLHVLARDADGAAIGTARLVPPAPAGSDGAAGDAPQAPAKIARMAVLPAWRGVGVGAALLDALLRAARARGWTRLMLNAQVSAEAFYARHGFVAYGPRFVVAGIEHQAMRRTLDRPQAVADRDAAVAVACPLIAAARRRLWIYSRELDPGLFDHPQVLEALRAFAVRGRGVEVRILLQDAAAPQRVGAPLLALAQRLPSVFAFREVEDPIDRAYVAAFLVNDAGGYYFRSLGHRFEGEAETDAPGRARQLAEAFRPVWERARPVAEYRALGI